MLQDDDNDRGSVRVRRFDWRNVWRSAAPRVAVDSRRRLHLAATLFALLAAAVLARVVALELRHGDGFRAEATAPHLRSEVVPAPRGRILARDGTVLAYDRQVATVAVHYRYLEDPPRIAWLRARTPREIRSRLLGASRFATPQEEMAAWRVARDDMLRRLAAVSDRSPTELREAAQAIEGRVRRISESVNRRHKAAHDEAVAGQDADALPAASGEPADPQWRQWFTWLFPATEPLPPAAITIAEELQHHALVDDVPLAAVAEIEAHPELYPGVRIEHRPLRIYPQGELAANLVGYVGPPTEQVQGPNAHEVAPPDRVGRAGLEREYDKRLQGLPGTATVRTTRGRDEIVPGSGRAARGGNDVRLALDVRLQQSAEKLLDSAIARIAIAPGSDLAQTSGAAIVLDVESGEILAAASAPRFDPNVITSGSAAAVRELLSDERKPLFDRAAQMAIPPGSVFKVVTAAAIVERDPRAAEHAYHCRGYLNVPTSLRCMIYARHGDSHGDVTLADALAESCNVYFFHHAKELGPARLLSWATRFGFGQPTHIDLPHESAGFLPTPANLKTLREQPWTVSDSRELSVGQHALRATPLQVARMMAAIANGGKLVTPRLAASDHSTATDAIAATIGAITGLDNSVLAPLREGLETCVSDSHGTAHAAMDLPLLRIAGKTGTAETDDGLGDHAWFAGYAPADRPQVAVVVAIARGGDGSGAAATIAGRLFARLGDLGYIESVSPTSAPELTARAEVADRPPTTR